MCVHPWWTYLLFPAFWARFSWNVGADYSIYPRGDSTAAFGIVAVVTHPEVSFGISDEEKSWNLAGYLFSATYTAAAGLKTFKSVLSGSLMMMMMRMKTGEQGVCVFWCPICERGGSGPLLAPRSEAAEEPTSPQSCWRRGHSHVPLVCFPPGASRAHLSALERFFHRLQETQFTILLTLWSPTQGVYAISIH